MLSHKGRGEPNMRSQRVQNQTLITSRHAPLAGGGDDVADKLEDPVDLRRPIG